MRDELQTARRNFPRAEYQLVKDSFPETLHHLSPAKLNAHIERCQELIQSYRVRLHDKESLEHTWKKPERLGSSRLIRYRMNELNACLRKFRSQLRRSKGPAKKAKATSAGKRIGAKKAASATKVASVRRNAKSASSAKSSGKTRSLKAKRTMSAKMKTAKPKLSTRKAGTSKTIGAAGKKRASAINGASRKEATINDLTFARSSEQRYSQATAQPKMRLPRKGLQKGISNLNARGEKDILPSNSINPALRRR